MGTLSFENLTLKEFLIEARNTVGIIEITDISSENIKFMFIDERTANYDNGCALHVVFKTRNGDPVSFYTYFDVDQNTVDALIDANNTPLASVGSTFNALVKKGAFEYEKTDFMVKE